MVEVRQFDQYVVRVDGSGRVTLRNRKFLRKYMPVLPRAPLAMAPGPAAVLIPPAKVATPASRSPVMPPSTKPHPPHTDPSDTADDSPGLPAPPPVIQTPPPLTNFHPDSPRRPAAAGPVPRALRALLPHNAPGHKEHPIPSAPTPDLHTPPVRRSARQTSPSAWQSMETLLQHYRFMEEPPVL